MRRWDSPFKSLRAAAVISGAVAVLVFLNALHNGFAFDDSHIVVHNEAIQSLETLPGALLQPYWPGEYGQGLGLWRPMATFTYGLEWILWGDNPVLFHLTNILLHAGVTALVVLLLGEILPVAAAFVAGLVFAVHPIHVEAVANVVGRGEILAALFFLLAALVLQRGRRRMGWGRLAAVLFLYTLAFLTKESAITLLGVVLLLDSGREDIRVREVKSYLRDRWPLYLGMILIAGVLLWARVQVLGSAAQAFAPLGAEILEEVPRIHTVTSSWPHIFRLLFFPQDLVVDYGPAVIPIAFRWNAVNLLGVVLVLAALLFGLFSWGRGALGPNRLSPRAVGWGVVWFTITLSPTSNMVFLSGILLSERTLYLPSVGFVAAAAWLLLRFHQDRPRLAKGVVVLSLALLAGRSWTRTPTWKDNLEVFNTLILEHPESGRAQWVLGDVYFQTGQVSKALRSYRLAVGIIGGHYTLLAEMGRRLVGGGYDRAAELILTYAWEDHPELGFAPGLLATVYERQGRYVEAERAARACIRDNPELGVQYHLLSRALKGQGRLEEAREARLDAIRFGEGEHWEQWGWLAELELALGDTASANRAMDSARVAFRRVGNSRQIDSFFTDLGLVQSAEGGRESARDSQNPRYQAP